MNRIYLAFPDMGFPTSYYLSVNDLVIEQCAADIQALPMPKFVSWRARKWLQPAENLYFLHTTYTGAKFAQDMPPGACGKAPRSPISRCSWPITWVSARSS